MRELESFGVNALYENLDNNPYIEKAYQGNSDYAFPSQLIFAADKYVELLNATSGITAIDQSLVNVRAYTRLHQPDAWRALKEVFDYTEEQFGPANLIVHLHCPVAVQLDRIRHRGRKYETGVTATYCHELNTLIKDELLRQRKKGVSVVEYNTKEVCYRTLAGFVYGFLTGAK